MPTLHALLVAIDQYPNPKHVLHGCVADRDQFHIYLDTYCQATGLQFNPKVLTDKEATRQAVIDAFDHFQDAKPGDQCLFFYAGHGSRSKAPEIFMELETDGMVESIVCWDSRQENGHDLMDKEISYLVWNAMKDKEMPMITIMDCCHSGEMRDVEVSGSVRQLREVGPALAAEEYCGSNFYKKDEKGQMSPPIGRRIHLAASRDVETAKEVKVKGQSRGIFTYCLIQALHSAGHWVSYAELIDRARMRVHSNMTGQSPQLNASRSEDKYLRFLSDDTDTGARPYLVTFDRTKARWVINAGTIHGLRAGNTTEPTRLELIADGTPLTLAEVFPATSYVQGMEGHEETLVYPVKVVWQPVPRLKLNIAPDSDTEGIQNFRNYLQQHPNDFFWLDVETDQPDFTVHALSGALFLTKPQENRPLFQRVEGYDIDDVKTFAGRLEVVANWQQIYDLSNPNSSISDSDLEISLYRITAPGNYSDDAPKEQVDIHAEPEFSYQLLNGEWKNPALQLSIRNKSNRPLWVSLLYLGANFSVNNQLLPAKVLLPDGIEWARDIYDGQTFRTIMMELEDAYLRSGVRSIREFFKVIVSTQQLHTDMFNQEGLDLDTGEIPATRGIASRSRLQPEQDDWRTFDIAIRISSEKE